MMRTGDKLPGLDSQAGSFQLREGSEAMNKQAKRNTGTNPEVNMQWGLSRAKKRGLRVVEPRPNELQIDLDGARALRVYGMQFSTLRRAGLTAGWRERVTPSKSGGNRVHITITMPVRVDNFTRVLLQAILGSDIKREAFNYCRVKKGNKYPIVFFEKGHHEPWKHA